MTSVDNGGAKARRLTAAVLRRPAVSPLAVTISACGAERPGVFDHLVLIVCLGGSIGLQAGVAQLLHEGCPRRIGDWNRYAVGAGTSRDRQQVRRLRERQRRVLDSQP